MITTKHGIKRATEGSQSSMYQPQGNGVKQEPQTIEEAILALWIPIHWKSKKEKPRMVFIGIPES